MGPRIVTADEKGVVRVELHVAMSEDGRVVVPELQVLGNHPDIPEKVETDIGDYLKQALDLDGCKQREIAIEFCL